MQAEPGGPAFDLGGLADGIVNGFRNTLEWWAQDLVDRFTRWLQETAAGAISGAIERLWNGIWSSGLNLFATPYDLTIDFPPARMLGREVVLLVPAIGVLALVLLCLRNMWRTMTGARGTLQEAFDGFLLGLMLASASTTIVGLAYTLVGLASDAFGRFDYTPAFKPHDLLSIGPDILIGVFILIAMIFFGWKLILKAAYRVVLLMFLTPFAPVAGALWAIPQLRWVGVTYFVVWGGWLAGGFLAIGALSLGVQLAIMGSREGPLALVFSCALMKLASDLMSILTRGGNMGGSNGAIQMVFSAATGGAIGAAAGAAASGGSSAGVAGALPSGSGDAPGFGY